MKVSFGKKIRLPLPGSPLVSSRQMETVCDWPVDKGGTSGIDELGKNTRSGGATWIRSSCVAANGISERFVTVKVSRYLLASGWHSIWMLSMARQS